MRTFGASKQIIMIERLQLTNDLRDLIDEKSAEFYLSQSRERLLQAMSIDKSISDRYNQFTTLVCGILTACAALFVSDLVKEAAPTICAIFIISVVFVAYIYILKIRPRKIQPLGKSASEHKIDTWVLYYRELEKFRNTKDSLYKNLLLDESINIDYKIKAAELENKKRAIAIYKIQKLYWMLFMTAVSLLMVIH